METVAVCQITRGRRITIPRRVANKLNVKDGDSIVIIENDGEFKISPASEAA